MSVGTSSQWSYRPSHMPQEAFNKTFTGRKEELESIFQHIYFNLVTPKDENNKKNIMIQGERGVGKTSLLLAVKYGLMGEHKGLLKKIVPVFFNESEHINATEKFALRLFDIVANESPNVFKESLAHPEEWQRGIEKIKKDSPRCVDILKQTLVKEQKKLVLFIENFDDLVYRILRRKGKKKTGKEGSKNIFERWVRDPDILMICTALEEPATSHEYGRETFRVIPLESLSIDNIYEMIVKRAEYEENLFLLANKEKLKNKVKAFEYLTGGNTRLMVHLYQCLVERSLDRLVILLDDMVNKSTPLFEWIIERFVDYESREILDAIARRHGNATVKEIAEDTLSNEGSVRTLLSRLRNKNLVEKIKGKRERSDIYIMIPMMFFIWFQKVVLQNSTMLLDFFIQFVGFLFDPDELKEQMGLVNEPAEREGGGEFNLYFDYVQQYIDAGKFPLKSSDEKSETTIEVDTENEQMIYNLVEARKDDAPLHAQLKKAFAFKAENKLPEAANLFRIISRGYLMLSTEIDGSYRVQAEENIRRAIEIYRGIDTEPLETVRCQLELVKILSDTNRIEELKHFAVNIIRTGKKFKVDEFASYIGESYKYLGIAEKDDFEKKLDFFKEALRYFEDNIDQSVTVLVNIALTYMMGLKKNNVALQHFEKALELSKGNEGLNLLGDILPFIIEIYHSVKDHRGALSKIDEYIDWAKSERKEIDFHSLYFEKAYSYAELGEYTDAEKFFMKSLELAKKQNRPNGEINALMSLVGIYWKLNRAVEARKIIRRIQTMVENIPELQTGQINEIVESLTDFGYFDEAIVFNEKLIKKFVQIGNIKGHVRALFNIGFCYQRQKDFVESEKNYLEAIELATLNGLKKEFYDSKLRYAHMLIEKGNIDEAISIYEKYQGELNYTRPTITALVMAYLRKILYSFVENDPSTALSFWQKILGLIDKYSPIAFLGMILVELIVPLIRKTGPRAYDYVIKLEPSFAFFYTEDEKGRIFKVFSSALKLIKGERFEIVARDLPLEFRGMMELINEELKKASEINNEDSPGDGAEPNATPISYAASAFERIHNENLTEIDDIVDISGSPTNFLTLLHLIFVKFQNSPLEKQIQMIAILSGIIKKSEEPFKREVLNWFSLHFSNFKNEHQETIINAFLIRLKVNEDSEQFLNEVRSFLNTAKTMVDTPLKEKIEKEMLELNLKDKGAT